MRFMSENDIAKMSSQIQNVVPALFDQSHVNSLFSVNCRQNMIFMIPILKTRWVLSYLPKT